MEPVTYLFIGVGGTIVLLKAKPIIQRFIRACHQEFCIDSRQGVLFEEATHLLKYMTGRASTRTLYTFQDGNRALIAGPNKWHKIRLYLDRGRKEPQMVKVEIRWVASDTEDNRTTVVAIYLRTWRWSWTKSHKVVTQVLDDGFSRSLGVLSGPARSLTSSSTRRLTIDQGKTSWYQRLPQWYTRALEGRRQTYRDFRAQGHATQTTPHPTQVEMTSM